MIQSIRSLFNAPYNKKHPFFALNRFVYWKLIRLLKLKNIKYRIWGDKTLLMDYDSLQNMWIMYNYILDWEEFNLISKYVREDDQIMDVGANIGAYSVWMSKFILSPGKIHAFEPDQDNFTKLLANISNNRIEKLIAVNKTALSDIDGILSFTTGLDRLNHIVKDEETNTVKISAQRLDTYMREQSISRIAYLKIDVEGFEYAVLKGAHEALSEGRIGILQLEINKTLSNSGISIKDLLDLIAQYKYTLCSFDVDANRLLPVSFTEERENYFAVYDLEKANARLREPS